MPLQRIAWLITVATCVITGLLLLLSGYVGYAAVSGAAAGVEYAVPFEVIAL